MPDRAPSLAPMQEALARLELSFSPRRVILVGGTNGKGTTCAILESLLLSAGCRVGLYTSPHLVETTERIRLNGKDISEEEFVSVFDSIQKPLEGMSLSHFEMLTLMAARYFTDHKLDWMIFEVGLGGTWDATNAIPHHWAVLSRIGRDHEDVLGNKIESIFENKVGICRPGAALIHFPFPPEIPESLVDQFKKQFVDSKWIESPSYDWYAEQSADVPRFILETPWGATELPLPGKRTAENASLALNVFLQLGYAPEVHLPAVTRTCWKGRMQEVRVGPRLRKVYLSGDHNPQGAESLVELLRYYRTEPGRTAIHFIVGVGEKKDLSGILTPLHRMENAFLYLTKTPFRGRSADQYEEWRDRAQAFNEDPLKLLLKVCDEVAGDDLIVVTGSLYLVGKVLSQI